MPTDQQRRSSHDNATSGESRGGGAPGKKPVTAGLSGRSQSNIVFRVESAEAAQVFADAAFGPRDRNGVAAGADGAVDRATGSSGAALPEDLRGRFESSLGADLSAVRIHTGGESAEAASAVGAKAYTTGNDIHFNEGQYDPSSAFGVHLIAHEVAHTQQQAGSSPTRQHKLEISAPQDSAEVDADRAADAMVAGQAANVSGVGGGVLHLKKGQVTEATADVTFNAYFKQTKDVDKALAETIKQIGPGNMPDGYVAPPKRGQTTSGPGPVVWDGETPAESTSATDVGTAIAEISNAENAGENAIHRLEQWMVDETIDFITRTADSPGEVFKPQDINAIVAMLTGKAVGKAAGYATTAAVAGAAAIGLPELLAAMAIAYFADKIASSLKEKIEGGKDVSTSEAAAKRSEAIRLALKPKIKAIFKDGLDQRAPIRENCAKARKDVMIRKGQESEYLDWAMKEQAYANKIAFQSGSLYQPMLDRWVSTHALTPDLPVGVNGKLWENANKEMTGATNMPRAEFYLYKLRDEWESMGLDASPASTDLPVKGQVTFNRALDPKKFAAKWGGAGSEERRKHLASGGAFTLVCTYTGGTWMEGGSSEGPNLVMPNERFNDLINTHYVLDLRANFKDDIDVREFTTKDRRDTVMASI